MGNPRRSRIAREASEAVRVARADPVLPALLAMTMALAAVAIAVALLPLAMTAGDAAGSLARRLEIAGAGFSRVPGFPERSTIYARDGSVLTSLFLDEDRELVPLEEIAPVAREAVLAIEDDKFYEHGALDLFGLLRAVALNVARGEITQGGSTITQQLVKKAVIGDDSQTFARKFQEAALASRLEERYSKDEILSLYLNEVYFGNGMYGIGTAARFYFDVAPSELTLPQAALLAGLIQTPATYDPVANPEAARERRNVVLDRMEALGWVDEAAADAARATPVELQRGASKKRRVTPPFFVYYITESILDMDNRAFDVFGKTREQRVHTLYQGGLQIHTTLEPKWQAAAQAAVNRDEDLSRERGEGPDVSIVTIDAPTGGIRTMLSGKNYLRDKLDLVWRGRRQVGSAFKAITLAAAIEAGVPPTKTYDSTSPFCDERWKSEDGCVRNAEGEREGGPIDLWTATAGSVNVVFAQLALDIGPERIVDVAQRLGITAPLEPVPAITLGVEEVSTLDMATAYATLANDGVRCETYTIDRVTLSDGSPLYEHAPNCEEAIAPDVAHLVTAMLARVVSGGTGTRANLGRPVAGKTGTGQDYTNVYFAGYTPQVATAVWMGFPAGNIPMDSYYGRPVFGGTDAAPLWHDYMVRVVAGMPVETFPPAPGAISLPVPSVVGLSLEEARSALIAFSVEYRLRASGATDIVLGQSPASGTVLTAGSVVRIDVAEGSDLGVLADGNGLPNLVGLSVLDAIEILHEYRLSIRIEYPRDAQIAGNTWFVAAQTPDPGSDVGTTGSVTLYASLEPVPSAPPPSPAPSPTASPAPNPDCGLGNPCD
ncbi:MAG: transglycosylase domain-containing protein [Actinomycetota bacterium]